MKKRTKLTLCILASILLFVAVLYTVWFATFFVLWEGIYGDTYGGRWSRFAWPVALFGAISAVALFWVHVTGWRRINFGSLALWIFLFIGVALFWIFVVARILMPPL